ncbi:hypothetical protein IFM89_010136 [Coptis chinensis]|uniref:Uncharacterized protein n=1 Tax=Coptis chinensis TaxID=261450 RepID=A0A835IAP0_9MAGN|nr:hypothetical protein IFM89_010136 [Coptis chinensis]
MLSFNSLIIINSTAISQTFPTQFSSQLFHSEFGKKLSFHQTPVKARVKVKAESAWDEKPYDMFYLDEQDIASFLDPPKELIPLDPSSYNPAKYIWKKIEDIPEERRYRLLNLLKPRLISRLWEVAGTRYEDDKLVKQCASSTLLSHGDSAMPLEYWTCRTSGGQAPIAWINFFKKAIFRTKDGETCGRIIIGGSFLSGLANSFSPLYFMVKQQKEVMATEQPCDVAYEFGDGLLDVDYPNGFPRPVPQDMSLLLVIVAIVKHPWPFNDHVVVYIRHVGPGVLVGQGWQEGKVLEQVPKRLCGEIVMVKDYRS